MGTVVAVAGASCGATPVSLCWWSGVVGGGGGVEKGGGGRVGTTQ
jgi:hypothetical protein